MILVLFGPPGAGKGTQGVRIAEELAIPAISTGAIFREMAAAGTELGLTAKGYMSRGELVPDDIVVGLVKERIKLDDCAGGFILDGFPRTVAQAEALDAMLGGMALRIDGVLNFEVSDAELLKRLTGRRTCSGCGANYHVVAMPPKVADRCDQCGAALVQRADDKPESVSTRLQEYAAKTAPVLGYYQSSGVLLSIPADSDPDTIFGLVMAALPGRPA